MLKEFLAYLEEQVENHSIYVWGGQGQAYPTVTEAWIKSKETGTNRTKVLKTYRAAVAAGYERKLRAFDCSGLGMYWLQNVAKLFPSDLNANGMKGKCTLIQKSHLKKGDWVFKCNSSGRATHIGYVVDDDLNVIEAQGRAYGVVKRPLSKGGWNKYGRPQIFANEIDTQEDQLEHMSFNRNLKKGCKGDDVRLLQILLNKAGNNLVEDGDFGSKTEKAVKAAQRKHHLTKDGIAGRKTITALGGQWGYYPNGEIEVCTFNIKRGTYKSGTYAKIAKVIKDADIIGIQEVTPAGLKKIAAAAGLTSYMCETISGYGHAILTNFSVDDEEIVTLTGSGERRKLHHIQSGDVSIYNVHLHYTEPTNTKQLKQVADILAKDESRIVILTGDFNRQDYDYLISEGFIQTNKGQLIRNTEGGSSIVNKIDQVFLKGTATKDIYKYEAVKKNESDHDALFVEINI